MSLIKIDEKQEENKTVEQAPSNIDSTDETATMVDGNLLRRRRTISFIMFTIVSLYYVFLIVIGLLGIMMPDKGVLWTITDPISSVSANYVSGFICLLFVPSYCYYLGLRGPFNFNRLTRLILLGSGLAVSLIGIILYMALLNDYLVLLNGIMRYVPSLANIGLIVIYGLSILPIDPARIQKVHYDDPDEDGLEYLKVLFIYKIPHALMNLGRAILRVRQSSIFIAAGTILFTLCVFELVQILYVLLGVAGALLIIGVILFLYGKGSNNLSKPNEIIYVDGVEHNLSYYSYETFSGNEIYIDQFNNRWETRDGGQTFSRAE